MIKVKTIVRMSLAAALLSCFGAAGAQSLDIGTATVPSAAGGTVSVEISFTPDPAVPVASYNSANISYATIPGLIDAPVATNGAGACVVDHPAQEIMLIRGATFGSPIPPAPAEVTCTISFNIPAGTAVGDYAITQGAAGTSMTAPDGTPVTGTFGDGQISVVAEGPPDLTFDTTPVALPGGVFGSTVSDAIPATLVPSAGPLTTAYSCTPPAGFTIDPTSGTYSNTDTSADNIVVSATLGADPLSGNVECDVTPEGGSTTTFIIPVSAPAGAETAPALTPTPANGGEVAVGGGAPGSNGTGTLTVTPSGGVGTDVAEVFCEADAPVSISPASLTFPVGSSAQGFTVTVPLTGDAQTFPGAITCWGEDGNGGFEWSFDVSAPAGTVAPPPPTFIPATSLWSKFALIGVFAALGLLMVGLRRNH